VSFRNRFAKVIEAIVLSSEPSQESDFLLPKRSRGLMNLVRIIFWSVALFYVGHCLLSFSCPKAEGQIDSVRVLRGQHSVLDDVWLSYSFTVNQTAISIRNQTVSHVQPGREKDAFAQYLPGKHIAVYYNPTYPSDCVIMPGQGWGIALFWCACLLVILIAGWAFARRRDKSESEKGLDK
jgi:hypothetical protein